MSDISGVLANHERRRGEILGAVARRAERYERAIAIRNQLAARAAAPDAIDFDREAAREAERNVATALERIQDAGDPLPKSLISAEAKLTDDGVAQIRAEALAGFQSQAASQVDDVETVAARILAAAEGRSLVDETTLSDPIEAKAAEIIASARLAEAESVEATAARIAAA